MNEKLLAMYLEYASTNAAMAILCVKKNMPQSAKKWVDIISCERYELSKDKSHFRFIEYGLYKRTIKPNYPPESEFTDDNGKFDKRAYYMAVRAITWQAANLDIQQQKKSGIIGEGYQITGVPDNNEKYEIKPIEIKPLEVKTIEKLNSDIDKNRDLWIPLTWNKLS